MRIRVPNYFTDFKCIADKCTDSCCVGWEIDIDERTREKYAALGTELGREICEKTSHGCFPLAKNGCCAFLDEKGLCRIISSLGEGYLCDICREHPRYYGVGACGIEGGLGLGCEEAARIILSLDKLPEIVETERDIPYFDEDEFADVSAFFRERLFDGIFTARVDELVGIYKAYAIAADDAAFDACTSGSPVQIPKITVAAADEEDIGARLAEMLELLGECEPLTSDWLPLLNKVMTVEVTSILNKEQAFRPLLYYFTHRYVREGVADMSLGARVLFALGSALAAVALSEVIDCEESDVRAAVLYSKNIEYSTDNVDIILDKISVL